MIIKLDYWTKVLLFKVPCIMALLIALVFAAAGQGVYGQSIAGQSTAGQSTAGQSTAGQSTAGQSTVGQSTVGQSTVGQTITAQGASGQGIDTSGPDSAYCTGNGFLYTTVAGVNSGKAICRFPDGTWCDAHAYFTGDCAPSANATPVPSAYFNASNPYAYVNPYMYNNPQGALDIADATKTCQTYGGVVQRVHTAYGDVNMCLLPDGSYVDLMGLYSGVYGGFAADNWYYYAYSWLNAP